MPYLGIFRLEFGKIIFIDTSASSGFSRLKVSFSKKYQIWDFKCLIWVLLQM